MRHETWFVFSMVCTWTGVLCASCSDSYVVPPSPGSSLASFKAESGNVLVGTVSFFPADAGVKVVAELTSAPPGPHGIHIHEHGDCSAPDFSSAGGHFDPTGAPHACPPTEPRHAGDLGNIVVGADGTGRLELTTDLISLKKDDPTSIVGRSVILHADGDDCVGQPAGNSGARVACAVIHAH